MPCYLRITGDFDPDKFIEDVELPLEVRHRKGDVGRRGAIREEPLVQISISDAHFSDLDKQFEDMYRFVARHKDALKSFCRLDAITSCTFDFGGQFDPDYAVVCRTIPRNAVISAAVCYASIEISLYSVQKFDSEAHTAIQSRAEQDDGDQTPPAVVD